MSDAHSPLAGERLPESALVDVDALRAARERSAELGDEFGQDPPQEETATRN